ncbi:Phospholipid scramblase 3 [Desmophyllum pertusum]|uniref:Phospholipid scramblase n=1 Tax=Desmophyllum pertusum TaxID=174260 RepID=A0A9X0A3W9_9CNID|nr:Phospholipid scramblase 3 [Desmophyllum pertusum]
MAQPEGYGYPPPVESGYPPPQQGYPPAQQGGYPPPQQGGYPPPQQGGYPPPQPGYAPAQPGYAPPVSQQPGSYAPAGQGQWMQAPPVPANCPPGLEYLTQIDQLLIKQQVELLEAFTGFETNNKYKIQNSMGQQVFFAAEEIEVQSPPGTVVGYCSQDWSICIPKFEIQDADRQTVLRIEGPFCQCNLCGDVEFQVLSADGQNQVGKISKQWSGLVKEAFTDADNFGITFPMDLDVKMKAVVLGSCFLIDFMFFEKAQGHDNDNF